MTSPQFIYVTRWLVGDTFRQAMASKAFWICLGFSTLAIVFCLSLSVEGGDNLRPEGDFLYSPTTGEPLTGPAKDLGRIHLLFGTMKVTLARDRESAVHLIEVILGSWVAGGAGLLVLLVWTAGFIPEFLQPATASVAFAKPVPRWLYLAGKYFGVVSFVTFQAAVFFFGTWLALGLRTDVWLSGYLAGMPLLVLQFATLFSVSVLLGVYTRSAVASALGAVLFWMMCFAVNYARHAALSLPLLAPDTQGLSSLSVFFVDLAYWCLPKPADMFLILESALNSQAHMATLSSVPEFATVRGMGEFHPLLSVLSGLVFAVVPLTMAGKRLATTDY